MYLSKLQLRNRERLYEIHRTIMHGFDDLQNERVLFRVESDVTIVQSLQYPDWNKLGARLVSHHVTQGSLDFRLGQALAFSLLANPTIKRNGKRHGLHSIVKQRAWLTRKAIGGGFEIRSVGIVQKGVIKGRTKSGHQLSLFAVQFDGELLVIKPDIFYASVCNGIGSGKGFGFGLLLTSLTK